VTIKARAGASIRISSVSSALVFKSSAQDDYTQVNLSGWQRGIYVVEITDGGTHAVSKLIVR